jgi:hypothetical protein
MYNINLKKYMYAKYITNYKIQRYTLIKSGSERLTTASDLLTAYTKKA